MEEARIEERHLLGNVLRLEVEQRGGARGDAVAGQLLPGTPGGGGGGGELPISLAQLLVALLAQALGVRQVAPAHQLVDELH